LHEKTCCMGVVEYTARLDPPRYAVGASAMSNDNTGNFSASTR